MPLTEQLAYLEPGKNSLAYPFSASRPAFEKRTPVRPSQRNPHPEQGSAPVKHGQRNQKMRDILEAAVGDGSVPGAVGLVARGGRVEVQAVGSTDVQGSAPMARDSIFRIASVTKPITAAAVMMLVEDGRIALDDPVRRWLPEPT